MTILYGIALYLLVGWVTLVVMHEKLFASMSREKMNKRQMDAARGIVALAWPLILILLAVRLMVRLMARLGAEVLILLGRTARKVNEWIERYR